MSSNPRYVRTIRLSQAEIDAYLDGLDRDHKRDAADRRGSERFPYRGKECLMRLLTPAAGGAVAYLVPTRNIGTGGMSFLHGGFLHPGSRCLIRLTRIQGAHKVVEATVVRCRYLEASIHEVAVRFKQEIDPAEYAPAAVKTRVLLVDDDPCVTRLATLLLGQLNAEVEIAENGRVALERAEQHVYDVILMDMEMPVLDGFEAVRLLREKGYTGTIVAVTARTQPADRQRCLEAGCDRFIAKPYQRGVLADVIESLRQEPLMSSLAHERGMAPLIDAFVAELPPKLRQIEDAFAREQDEQLETLCRTLKGEAGGYGFEPISAAAERVEKALIDRTARPELKRGTDELIRLCCLARSSARTTRAAAETGADGAGKPDTAGKPEDTGTVDTAETGETPAAPAATPEGGTRDTPAAAP